MILFLLIGNDPAIQLSHYNKLHKVVTVTLETQLSKLIELKTDSRMKSISQQDFDLNGFVTLMQTMVHNLKGKYSKKELHKIYKKIIESRSDALGYKRKWIETYEQFYGKVKNNYRNFQKHISTLHDKLNEQGKQGLKELVKAIIEINNIYAIESLYYNAQEKKLESFERDIICGATNIDSVNIIIHGNHRNPNTMFAPLSKLDKNQKISVTNRESIRPKILSNYVDNYKDMLILDDKVTVKITLLSCESIFTGLAFSLQLPYVKRLLCFADPAFEASEGPNGGGDRAIYSRKKHAALPKLIITDTSSEPHKGLVQKYNNACNSILGKNNDISDDNDSKNFLKILTDNFGIDNQEETEDNIAHSAIV